MHRHFYFDVTNAEISKFMKFGHSPLLYKFEEEKLENENKRRTVKKSIHLYCIPSVPENMMLVENMF